MKKLLPLAAVVAVTTACPGGNTTASNPTPAPAAPTVAPTVAPTAAPTAKPTAAPNSSLGGGN